MTIFRNMKNGRLYILAMGMRWNRNIEAIPYKHEVTVRKPKLKDFVAVATYK